jgi:Domain of unknown function (DUF3883)
VIWIEVKSTLGRDGRFEWSGAEIELAAQKRGQYVICRVYEAGSKRPTLQRFSDPLAMLVSQTLRLDVGMLARRGTTVEIASLSLCP